jgi:hypothetical protein
VSVRLVPELVCARRQHAPSVGASPQRGHCKAMHVMSQSYRLQGAHTAINATGPRPHGRSMYLAATLAKKTSLPPVNWRWVEEGDGYVGRLQPPGQPLGVGLPSGLQCLFPYPYRTLAVPTLSHMLLLTCCCSHAAAHMLLLTCCSSHAAAHMLLPTC